MIGLFLDILQGAVRLLSGVGVNDKTIQQIVGIVQYAGSLVKRGTAGYADLIALNQQVKVMVTENRPPTDEEWERLDGELRAVDANFAQLKERLG